MTYENTLMKIADPELFDLDARAMRRCAQEALLAGDPSTNLLTALEEALPFVAAVFREGGRGTLTNSGDVLDHIIAALAAAHQGKEG